ncbi:Modification methylase RsrI [termite gut metagenome]|uniref:site-specific DNA-methyltransferase (cytosine-N(4)-specific) n=1 Tax=termite gut metagenome TaxID=433724 RepID=A0A5J4RIT9_9ZZZZ
MSEQNYFNINQLNVNKVRDCFFTIADCVDTIQNMSKKSVNTIVTSPPYNLNKNYGTYNDNCSFEEWENLIDKVSKVSFEILADNGSFLLNVSPIPYKKTKEIVPLEALAYYIFKHNGYALRNSIVWHFNNMQNCTNRLSGRWEAILWFVKDINNYQFNLDDIRIPYITKKDKRLEGGTGRNPTDTWNYDIPESDFWYFDRVNNMTKNKLGIVEHPCIFPTPMIERIIKMTTHKGEVVLDPFLGSGTTLIAAQNLKRIGLGIELDEKFAPIIKKRIKNETANGFFD